MPPEYRRCVESWTTLHPDWKIHYWTESSLREQDLANPWLFDIDHPTMQANLARLEVVRLFGGVYLDADIECLKAIDPLLDGKTAFISMRNRSWFDNCVIAAERGHPWITELCQGYGPRKDSIKFILDMDGLFRDVTEAHPEVMRLPRHILNVSFDPGDDKHRANAYAVHHHVSLWKTMDQRFLELKRG